MKIKIYTFGKIKNSELKELSEYYLRLTSKYFKVETIELKDIKDRKVEFPDVDKYLGNSLNIFLSEGGKTFTSEQFANKLMSLN